MSDAPSRFQGPPNDRSSWLLLVVGLRERVNPRTYALVGFGLMLLKYLIEAAVVFYATGTHLTPLMFLSPAFTPRESLGLPESMLWLWFIWTLPFLWIAMSMSTRRVVDAGLSPWLSTFVFVPVFNIVFMLLMTLVPSANAVNWSPRTSAKTHEDAMQAVFAVAASIVFGGLMLFVSVYWGKSYGSSLFLGTPFMMSAMASYLYNRGESRGWGTSMSTGVSSVFFAGCAMMLFALEGAICIVMALPLFLPIGVFGGLIGKAIADSTRANVGLVGCLIGLPLLASLETYWNHTYEYCVVSTVVVQARPEVVWPNVIAFPEIPEPDDAWYFRLGVAAPRRARIEGTGVGAVRHCEFTTGAFVEPITVWDSPSRLSFDVTEQPAPMFELSPYPNVHPPHLDGFMRSHRGEFRLVDLGDGRTRVEGRTWYEVEMFPQWYWRIWCDTIIHRIHLRVLSHIADVTVSRPARAAGSDSDTSDAFAVGLSQTSLGNTGG